MNKYYGKSKEYLESIGISPFRSNSRRSYADKKWKKSVHERDNDTCICCNKSNLSPKYAHHLYSYRDNEHLRFDINNGVTMCKECHFEFHKIYGNGKNTKEQFEEYLKTKEAK